jgi:two-component system, NarL family, sensor histidine kinase DevS
MPRGRSSSDAVRPARPRVAPQDSLEERFRLLLDAGFAISSQHSLDGVLQAVVNAARAVVDAEYAALGVLSADGQSLVSFVTAGIDAAARVRIGDLPHGRGLLGFVIRERRPVRTADIARHPRRFGFPPHHPPMKSFLGVPITIHGSVFGNLYLTEKIGASEFSDQDEAVAVLLASQAAVAVENARLLEDSERLIEQVRDMQRQRDLSMAMMNHELRNALTGVYGWAERLVRQRTPEGQAQAAQEVYEGTEHTITLLNNFLDLTRLDAGKVKPVFREVNAANEARRAIAGLEPSAEEKNVALSAEAPASCPPLETDPVRLQQILVNLLTNAVRHSPSGGRVQVLVALRDGSIEFTVTDQGPGVPPEVRDRVFEPYERFDPQSGHGTGLGLPVSRRLAELLGGSLSVGDATGGGAAFTLSLPQTPTT